MEEVGVTAHAKEGEGAFVVLKGSTARKTGSPAWDAYVALRDEIVAQEKLKSKDNENLEFASDVEFSSPSAAATVVAAGNRNRRITWKLADGRTYAQWKESQVEAGEGRGIWAVMRSLPPCISASRPDCPHLRPSYPSADKKPLNCPSTRLRITRDAHLPRGMFKTSLAFCAQIAQYT
jgi:hypothetical protein